MKNNKRRISVVVLLAILIGFIPLNTVSEAAVVPQNLIKNPSFKMYKEGNNHKIWDWTTGNWGSNNIRNGWYTDPQPHGSPNCPSCSWEEQFSPMSHEHGYRWGLKIRRVMEDNVSRNSSNEFTQNINESSGLKKGREYIMHSKMKNEMVRNLHGGDARVRLKYDNGPTVHENFIDMTEKGERTQETRFTYNGGNLKLSLLHWSVGIEYIVAYYDLSLKEATYKVSYKANAPDVKGSVPVDGQGYINGDYFYVKGNDGNLTREGYKFKGWGFNPNDTKPLGRIFITKDTNLYAIWEKNKEPGELEVEKQVDKEEAQHGDPISYVIRLKNIGEESLNGVSVEDQVPNEVNIKEVTGLDNHKTDGNKVTGTVNLDGGVEKFVYIKGTIAENAALNEVFSNTVKAKDPNKAEVKESTSSSTKVVPTKGKLEGTIEATPEAVNRGDEVSYKITLENTGETPLEKIAFKDEVPNELEVTEASSSDGTTLKQEGNEVSGEFTIPGDSEIVITIKGKVKPDAKFNEGFINKAVITDPNNEGVSVTPISNEVKVLPKAGKLEISKVADKEEVKRGEELGYTITLKNTGEEKLSNIVIEDIVPSQLEDVEAFYPDEMILTKQDKDNKLVMEDFDLEGGVETKIYVSGFVKADAELNEEIVNTVVARDNTNPEEPKEIGQASSEGSKVIPREGFLEVENKVNKKEVKRGEELEYTITIKNTGETALQDVDFLNEIPCPLENVSIDEEAIKVSTEADGRSIAKGKLNIGVGETKTIKIKGTVNLKAPIDMEFPSTVVLTKEKVHYSAVSDETKIIPRESALQISKEVDKQVASHGDDISYVLKLKNTGDAELKGVKVTDSVPTAIEITEVTGLNGKKIDGNLVTGTVDIEGESEKNVFIRGKIKADAKIEEGFENTAEAKDPNKDTAETATSPSTKVVPTKGKLEGTIEATPEAVNRGDEVSYKITLENTGETPLGKIAFKDEVPNELEVTEVSSSDGTTLKQEGNEVSGEFNIPANSQTVITIKGKVKPDAKFNEGFINKAVITGPNNEDVLVTPISNEVKVLPKEGELKVSKIVDKTEVKRGGDLLYTIRLNNVGESELKNIEVIDLVPTQLKDVETYISKNAKGHIELSAFDDGDKVEGEIDLAGGQEVIILVSGNIKEEIKLNETFTNTVEITDPNNPESPLEATSGETKVVPREGELEVSNAVDKTEIRRGEEVTYTITVKNTGEGDLTGVSIEDNVPEDLEDVSVTGHGNVTADGNLVSGTVDIKAGETITLTIKGKVGENTGLYTSFANTVEVKDPNVSTDPIEAISEETLVVPKAVNIGVTKKVDKTEVKIGEKLTYTITIVNNGEEELKTAEFLDYVPSQLTNIEIEGPIDIESHENNVIDGIVSLKGKGEKLELIVTGTVGDDAIIGEGFINTVTVTDMENPDVVIGTKTATSETTVVVLKTKLEIEKERAIAEIEAAATAKNNAIDAVAGASDEDKKAAKSAVEQAKNDALDGIKSAKDIGEVDKAKTEGLTEIKNIELPKNSLEVAKETAKKEIDEAGQKRKDEIDEMTDVLPEARQAAKDKVDEEVINGHNAVDAAETKDDVTKAKDAAIETINKVAPQTPEEELKEAKTAAKKEIDEAGQKRKDEIDEMTDVLPEARQAAKDKVDEEVINGHNAVDAAETKDDVTKAKDAAIETINKVAPQTPEEELKEAKTAAKKEIDEAGQKRKDEIDEMTDVLPEARQAAKDKVDEEVINGHNAVDAAETKDDVTKAKDAAIETINKVAPQTPEEELKEAKTAAKKEIDEAGQKRKDEIDEMTDVLPEARQAAKDKVDEEVINGHNAVDAAETKNDVTKAKDAAIETINKVAPQTPEEELKEAKTAAKKEIDEAGQKRKDEIDEMTDVLPEARQAAKDKVDEEVINGHNAVDAAETKDDVTKAKDAAIETINKVAPQTPEEELKEAKTAAKKEIDEAGQKRKDEIDEMTDVLPEARQAAKDKVDEEVINGHNAVDAAETKNDVTKAKDAAIETINKVAPQTPEEELKEAKTAAKKEIDEAGQKRKDEIDEMTDVLPEARQAAKDKVDEEVINGHNAVDAAETKNDVTKAKDAAIETINKVAPQTPEEELKEAKTAAKKEIDEAGQKRKDEIDEMTDVLPEARQAAKDKVDEEVINGHNAVDAAETKNDVTKAKDAAIEAINNVIPTEGNLIVTNTVDKVIAKPGEEITYTVTLTNTGDGKLEGVLIAGKLPEELEGVTVDGPEGVTTKENEVSGTVDIEAGETITLTIKGTVKSGTKIGTEFSNKVTVTDPTNEGNPIEITSGTTKVVEEKPTEGNLIVTNTVDKVIAKPGEEITYTIKLTNTGDGKLEGVSIVGKLPEELEGVTVDGPEGVTAKENEVSGTVDIEAGETITLTIKGTVKAGIKTGTKFSYTLSITDPTNPDNPIAITSESSEIADNTGLLIIRKIDSRSGENLKGAKFNLYKMVEYKSADAEKLNSEIFELEAKLKEINDKSDTADSESVENQEKLPEEDENIQNTDNQTEENTEQVDMPSDVEATAGDDGSISSENPNNSDDTQGSSDEVDTDKVDANESKEDDLVKSEIADIEAQINNKKLELENMKTEIKEKFVASYVTDDDGKIVSDKLDPGEYIIREVEAPEGYIYESIERNFEILGREDESYQFVIENTKDRYSTYFPMFYDRDDKKDDVTIPEKPHYAYMIGYPDGTFRPENNITRAEVSTLFFRIMEDSLRDKNWSSDNGYPDVNKEDWYNNAISTMSNAKMVTGYPDETFKPNANITRGEFATMAMRYLSKSNISSEMIKNSAVFSDVNGNWAEESIKKLSSYGYIKGYEDGSFKPNQEITRAEAAKIMNAILDRKPHKDMLLSNMKRWTDNSDTNAWYYADVQEATNSHSYVRKDKLSFENWKSLLPVRDWASLEKMWSKLNSK